MGCVGLVLLFAAAVSVSCSHSTPRRRAVVDVAPASGLLDSPVTLSVSGVGSHAKVTIAASTRDAGGVVWSSLAQFTANGAGSVMLTQPSTGGSYVGVDAMGLFDLMSPQGSGQLPTELISPPAGYDVQITVTVTGKVVATATLHRSTPESEVTATELRPATSHLYGELDQPTHSTGREPAVLVLGGSEGGVPAFTSRMLAAHGYPALALAYFKEPGLPPTLENIPLEYFLPALTLLRTQADVDPNHVLILGTSRGSEAALLLGAHYPTLVNGVIAGSPSSVANPGYPTGSTAWTLAGKPVPTVSLSDYANPNPSNSATEIPVENIRGPILTVCGQQDRVWPSCAYAAAITTRLNAHHDTYQHLALTYPGTGHAIGSIACCYATTQAALNTSGGFLQNTQTDLRDAWQKLLTFLGQQ